MRIRRSGIFCAGLFLLSAFVTLPTIDAQIVNQVDATISHSFIVGTKTLPPGKYTFRIQEGSDGGIMTLTSADGKNSDLFQVRESQAASTPARTELVFRRYGEKEFLTKIYEGGNKLGVAVAETSKVEKELKAQGQQPTEHSEDSGG